MGLVDKTTSQILQTQPSTLTFAQAIAIADVAIAIMQHVRIASCQLLDSVQALLGRVVEGVNHHDAVVACLEQFEACVGANVPSAAGNQHRSKRTVCGRSGRRKGDGGGCAER